GVLDQRGPFLLPLGERPARPHGGSGPFPQPPHGGPQCAHASPPLDSLPPLPQRARAAAAARRRCPVFRGAGRRPSPCCDYLTPLLSRAFLALLKALEICWPTSLPAPMAPRAIRATSRAYSTSDAPSSRRVKKSLTSRYLTAHCSWIFLAVATS